MKGYEILIGEDYKNRIIRYLENFYEFDENDKERLIVDDSLFLRTVCCALRQLITELQFSVNEIRIGAIENESIIIPVCMKVSSWKVSSWKSDGYVWDLEKLNFMY